MCERAPFDQRKFNDFFPRAGRVMMMKKSSEHKSGRRNLFGFGWRKEREEEKNNKVA
jgi:hypothetical protein